MRVNEFIENKSIQQIMIEQALTNYELVVLETVKRRDDFDLSLEGKKLKSLQAKDAICKRKRKNRIWKQQLMMFLMQIFEDRT